MIVYTICITILSIVAMNSSYKLGYRNGIDDYLEQHFGD
jgi:hypothetical protein